MAVISAGIMLYRKSNRIEVFLVHPGGPFFKNKDAGAWTIPKGLPEENENLEQAALRELKEETGIIFNGELVSLGDVVQKGGKRVYCFAGEIDFDYKVEFKSNEFEMEWPPKSGRRVLFPEADRGEFFDPEEAKRKINPAQSIFIDRLLQHLNKK